MKSMRLVYTDDSLMDALSDGELDRNLEEAAPAWAVGQVGAP